MPKKAAVPPPAAVPAGPGKGHATPSRREAEQARRRPLVPTDRKQAQRVSRSQTAADRERIRIGMASGEERYLPARDKGPQRRFIRDSIDARWTVGEFLIPVFVLFFFTTLIAPVAVQGAMMIALYGYLGVTVLDGVIAARVFRRRLAAKLGGPEKVERGLTWYTIMRAAQLRRLRLPKPQVKRGATVR
ncbi:MAG: hypothetical protein QOC59_1961 [Microbacteriaceae bacterium]|nr:hypothetical protein [Microbacteriaceae bacterium]